MLSGRFRMAKLEARSLPPGASRLAESGTQHDGAQRAPFDERHLANNSRIHSVAVRAWHSALRHHGHADYYFCAVLAAPDQLQRQTHRAETASDSSSGDG